MIGKTRALAVGLVVLLAAPAAAVAQADEFVRQERWANVTWQFQDGYAMGIWDTVQDLADFPADVRAYLPLLIRKAHTCLRSMTQSTEVATFASRAIARIANPQQNVISSLVSSFAACDVVGAPSNSTVDAVGGTFMWKGRWDTDRELRKVVRWVRLRHPLKVTREMALAQCVTEQLLHLGEVEAMLWQLDVSPPTTLWIDRFVLHGRSPAPPPVRSMKKAALDRTTLLARYTRENARRRS